MVAFAARTTVTLDALPMDQQSLQAEVETIRELVTSPDNKPNEVWHEGTTIIRLVDGTRAYLHAVIDNFSRRILSWRVAPDFDTGAWVTTLCASLCAIEAHCSGDACFRAPPALA